MNNCTKFEETIGLLTQLEYVIILLTFSGHAIVDIHCTWMMLLVMLRK